MPDDPIAHRCENCIAPPGRPCPHWISAEDGIFETNDVTHEQRLFSGCSCGAFQARMARYVIGTIDHFTTEISAGRAEMTATIDALNRRLEYNRKSVIRAIEDVTKQASREAVLEQFADVLIENRARIKGPNGA